MERQPLARQRPNQIISIVCMIYHMKVHMFGYNLGPPKMSKTKIHILTISEQISMKPAIVTPET